jgi:predicted permease
MGSDRSTNDWRPAILERARAAGVELTPGIVDELAAHLDDLLAAGRRAGATAEEATRQALAALDEEDLSVLARQARRETTAPSARVSDDTARVAAGRGLSLAYALRIALRQFRQHPAFALITVLVLGLGTGAAAAVYTIVDGVVLRPLPYRAPDRLVMIWDTNHEKGLRHELISPVNFTDYRALQVFEDAAAWWRPEVNLADPGLDPVRVKTIETSANLFALLGVAPRLGPGFPRTASLYSNHLVCVISDRLWRARYNADPSIIGRPLRLNNTAYTVVGVMPPGFSFPGDVDVWERLSWDLAQHSRQAHFMEAVARLSPGTPLARAAMEARALGRRLAADHASSNRAWNVVLVPLLDEQLGYYRPALMVLFGAVGLLLVIGCLNVTSLLLTRALSRRHEMAVRTALGASPRQLVAQLLAESLVLSVAGAAVGTIAAAVAVPLVVRLTPVPIPRLAETSLNLRVLGFSVGIVGATTILFGLVPALVLLRQRLAGGFRSGGRSTSPGVRRTYQLLMTGEVALAGVLLLSSALLVRTVQQMTRVSLGIDADAVVLSSVQLDAHRAADFAGVGRIHSNIVEGVRAQPGVIAAGAANFLPLEPGWRLPFQIDGQPAPARPEDAPQAQIHSVSEGFFDAVGARLTAGRAFTERDTAEHPGVVVVNETFARRYLRGAAVGSRIVNPALGIGPLGLNLLAAAAHDRSAHDRSAHAAPLLFEVVGVVADIRNVPLGQEVEPAIYFTARQFPFCAMHLAVRARTEAEARAAITTAVRDVAREVPLGDMSTWGAQFRIRTAEPRLLMTVLLFFAALAGLLAAVGIYGLFSWLVALRRQELAIRLTLGARPIGIGALVVRQGAVLLALGLTAGIVVVRLGERMLAQVLFEVQAGDALSTAAASGLLTAAALVACAIPALRAAGTDPVETLRAE